MKFTWDRQDESGVCAVYAHAEDYDAYPVVSKATMDAVPRIFRPDRVAAACVLLFKPYISGGVSFPYPISPKTQHAIGALLSPTDVSVRDLDFEPKRIDSGSLSFDLIVGPRNCSVLHNSQEDETRTIVFRSVRASEYFSAHFAGDILTVPNNAEFLLADRSSTLRGLLPHIGFAVLLADDYDVGSIRLPAAAMVEDVSEEVAELLRSVGILLVIDTK